MGNRDPVVAHCEAILRRGSRSFFRAASVLPEGIRHGAFQLYAWCRYCDDVIDHQELGHGQRRPDLGPDAQRALLTDLRRRTRAALDDDTPDAPEFLGLRRIARTYGIPPELPFALLDGMAMDIEGRRYESIDDLVTYCYHVAGVVGVMMAHMMESADAAATDLSRDLGIAFQLTNISRDVMDDAAVGRVYLPLDWLAEAGVDPDMLSAPASRPAVTRVVARVLDHADSFYRAADRGLSRLPFRLAWAVAAARGMYSDIGTVIRRRKARAWDRRAVVPAPKKLFWMGQGLTRAVFR